jgi:hypothetical protein
MPATDSVETLTSKLGATLTAQREVEQLYVEAAGPACRLLYRLCAGLPLGTIPLSLIWAVTTLVLPRPTPADRLNFFMCGLLLEGAMVGLLLTARLIVDTQLIADEILADIPRHPGFAYHPNSVLRRHVAAQGYATIGQFRVWADAQEQILSNRANDYVATLQAMRRPRPSTKPDALSAGARAFLDD